MLTLSQEAWLQALESGEFKQTRQTLQAGDSFCCLGVACVLAEKAGVDVHKNGDCLYGSTLAEQPDVRYWLGLRTSSGSPRQAIGSGVTILVNANDRGKTFKDIAAMVRANPEDYFDDREPGTLAPSPGVG